MLKWLSTSLVREVKKSIKSLDPPGMSTQDLKFIVPLINKVMQVLS